MNNSFVNLVFLQLREFIREPEVLFWALIFPIVLSGVLGLAFSQQGEVVNKVAILENDQLNNNSSVKALLAIASDSTQTGNFQFLLLPEEEALLKLKRGEVGLLIEPAPKNKVIYYFDARNENARMQHLLVERQLYKSKAVQSEVRPVETRGTRYIDFLIPGMIALGIMNSCIWGIGWNLIELRIKKLLRRMVATPMSKAQFLLAQITTRLCLTLFEAICLWGFAYAIFDFQLQGNFLTVLLLLITGNIAFAGIAVLVASRPQKTQVGSGIVNFVTLGLTILSGIFFSYTNFPDWAAGIIRFLPLTLLADGLRGVFNEGAGFFQLASNMFWLIGYGAFCFFLGLKAFKWY